MNNKHINEYYCDNACQLPRMACNVQASSGFESPWVKVDEAQAAYLPAWAPVKRAMARTNVEKKLDNLTEMEVTV
ncbi:MAG: hypothetical protein IPM54_25235 [Polyangiaceae bacterium]|nr:hypothetical protein [Polyangiaceae bacterium]